MPEKPKGTLRSEMTEAPKWYRRQDDMITVTLHVQPGAKRSALVAPQGEALRVKLAAPPIEGRANAALVEFLADLFEVPRRSVRIRHGAKARYKVLEVTGSKICPEDLLAPSKEPWQHD